MKNSNSIEKENKKQKNIPKKILKQDVVDLIDNYLSSNKFQNNLNALVLSTLSSKKTMTMNRKEIINTIENYDYIKNIENEILNNLYQKYNFEVIKDNNANQKSEGKTKRETNYSNVAILNDPIEVNLNNNSFNDLNALNNNNNTSFGALLGLANSTNKLQPISDYNKISKKEIDNHKLLNYLIEDILMTPSTKCSLESMFNDLKNFKEELILEHPKLPLVISKLSEFLIVCGNNDIFHMSYINSLIEKLSKTTDHLTLINLALCVMNYLEILVKKFFNTQFDISRFYKLFFNVKMLNNIIIRFYGEMFISRRIAPEVIEKFVTLLFKIILHNYDNNNSIYIISNSKTVIKDKDKVVLYSNIENQEQNNLKNEENNDIDLSKNMAVDFGISTNYILLILFCIDEDYSSLKILFRLSMFRKIILQNFELFKYLPFIDYEITKSTFKKKYCFLWKHFTVLDQIINKIQVTKKFLLYSWFSIKINFLGLVLRYKLIRKKYFEYFSSKSRSFSCINLFKNLLKFLLQVIFVDKTDDKEEKKSNVLNNSIKSLDNVSSKINNSNKLSGFEYIYFEDWQKEKIIFLCKEVLCDFVLYCGEKKCIKCKKEYIVEMSNHKIYGKDYVFTSVLEDIDMAIKEIN